MDNVVLGTYDIEYEYDSPWHAAPRMTGDTQLGFRTCALDQEFGLPGGSSIVNHHCVNLLEDAEHVYVSTPHFVTSVMRHSIIANTRKHFGAVVEHLADEDKKRIHLGFRTRKKPFDGLVDGLVHYRSKPGHMSIPVIRPAQSRAEEKKRNLLRAGQKRSLLRAGAL